MTTDNKPPIFSETHIAYVDDFGRVILPQEWREVLAEHEIGMILLSDGRDEHRLVVYLCPSRLRDSWRSAPTSAWGDLLAWGEFVHRVDSKGRFITPTQFREHCQSKLLLLKGCNDHFIISPHERKLEGVDTIKGVREYLWPETDILFVKENLPYDGVATPLFGPAARKIWQTFYEVGLVTRLFKDPLAAEAVVFGSGLFVADNLRLSIMTLNWRAEPIVKDGWEVIIADWRRVDTVCEKLKAKKIAYLGKKLANKGSLDWMIW